MEFELLIIYPVFQVSAELINDDVDLILLAPLQIDHCVFYFFCEILRMTFCDLHDLHFLDVVIHDCRVKDVELGEVKVVSILIQKLKCFLFVHVTTSEPDPAEVALHWTRAHDEGAKLQVFIQLLLRVFSRSFKQTHWLLVELDRFEDVVPPLEQMLLFSINRIFEL